MDIIRTTPGDRVEIGNHLILAGERPADWPKDWQHGALATPDLPCIPDGERCGPHRCSWPSGPRCVVGALWDAEQAGL